MAKKTLRRTPVQDRSRDTVAVILEGAVQLLDRTDGAAPSMAAIAKSAGVSVGSVYQYFESKDRVLDAVEAELFGRLLVGVEALVGTEPSQASVEAWLAALMATHRQHHGALRYLSQRAIALGRSPGEPSRVRAVALASQLLQEVAGLSPEVADGRATTIVHALVGVFSGAVMAGPDRLFDADLDVQITALLRALTPEVPTEAGQPEG